jgi:methylated-DNA-[protein]-cysteine S-methyltransferase
VKLKPQVWHSSRKSSRNFNRDEAVRIHQIARFFIRQHTALGVIGIIWKDIDNPVVERILLPGEKAETRIGLKVGELDRNTTPPLIEDIARSVEYTLRGNATLFDLHNFDLARCSPFQRKVLIAESKIPRGYVSTYGRIAAYLGVPGGARAVGNALGANPFPIVIPCHRAIRSDGSIGGFRGGIAMKKKLLEMEGVRFSKTGKVVMSRIFYS